MGAPSALFPLGGALPGRLGVDARPLGTAALNAAGQASITLSTLPGGTNDIVAVYEGNDVYGSAVSNTVPVAIAKAPAVAGPRVTAVQRYGYGKTPTTVVLTFDEAMDPARAQNVANYRMVGECGRVMPVVSATYYAQTNQVALRFSRLLPLDAGYILTVSGKAPNGVTDASGRFLAGAGPKRPGTNFTTLVTRHQLVLTPWTPPGSVTASALPAGPHATAPRLVRNRHVSAHLSARR